MSSSTSSEDVDEKYQKLSVEFARLRNEIPNLREKLDEERQRSVGLHDEIRKRDVTIRKIRSDNESLTFRNEQLSKRVETLQISLDSTTATFAMAKASKKHKEANLRIFGSPAMEPSTSNDVPVNSSQLVLEQELERKLAENAYLHTQLFDMEKQHETVVMEFSSIVKKLEAENELMKKRLMERPSNAEDDKELAEIMANGFTNPVEEESVKNIISEVLMDCQHALEALTIVFSQVDARSAIYPCDATLESVPEAILLFGLECGKIAEELRDMTGSVAVIHMRLSEDETTSMVEVKENLVELRSKFGLLLKASLPDLISHFAICIRKECDAPWCNSQLDQLNSQFEKAFIHALQRLSHLCNLSDESEFNLQLELVELKKLFHKSRDVFGKKIFIENHLPTTSKKLKALNDSIDKGFLQFVQFLGRIQSRFGDSHVVEALSSTLWGRNSFVENGKTAGKKLSVLERQASVIEESQARLRTLQSRLTEAKDNEDLLVNELSQLKNELVQKDVKMADLETRIVVLDKQMEVLKGSTVDVNKLRARLTGKALDDYSVLEFYFCEELNKTVTELENVNATVARYRKDIDDMTLILQKLDVEQNDYKSVIDSKNGEVQRLKDELETTRQNYEEQIRVMSDHLAALNAKIIEKSEQLVQMNGESNGSSHGSSSLMRKIVRK